MDPIVSVIVPVYNVQAYLEQCLNSLVHQSLESIEIIVVDDGSTDKSPVIIESFKNKYPDKIRAFRKTNGGLSDARNFGIPYARGTYIGFIDSDDYVDLNLYESMYQSALQTSSLLTVCDIHYVDEKGEFLSLMKGLLDLENVTTQKCLFLSPLFAWNKLYHRSLFETYTYRYPVGLWYEDLPVSLPFFSLIDYVSYTPNVFVYYRQRVGSIMKTTTSDKVGDIFSVLDLVYRDFESRHQLSNYHDELEYLFIEHILLFGAFRFYRSAKASLWMQKSFEVMKTHFPNWKRNLYIKTLDRKYQIYLKVLHPYTWKFFQFVILRKEN